MVSNLGSFWGPFFINSILLNKIVRNQLKPQLPCVLQKFVGYDGVEYVQVCVHFSRNCFGSFLFIVFTVLI